jgi:uncharacterized membrane protein
MNNTKKLVYGALFAALTCVATMSIHIPTPGTGGYIHPGDALVVLSGIVLGPIYGGLAAGIGSALADFIGGYYIYVPITFVVKFIIAAVVAVVYRKASALGVSKIPSCILCGIFSTLLVAFGYCFFEYFLYGAGAFASIPSNLIQGISGLVFSTILLPVVSQIPDFSEYMKPLS